MAGSRGRDRRDSRECPGPISEATLHRPSASRALTAGAIALAAIAPALDPADNVQAAPALLDQATAPATSAGALSRNLAFDPHAQVAERAHAERAHAERASRAAARRTPARRAEAPLAQRAARVAGQAAAREVLRARIAQAKARAKAQAKKQAEAREERRAALQERRAALQERREAVQERRTARTVREVRVRKYERKSVRRGHRTERVMPAGNGMNAVIEYARSQVGKNYVRGGEGPGGFDCSGFTKRAYERAGIRLPHSSGGQAARARTVSRSDARPGDLVVGPGHVGIYMGRGMMIDAGNSRTGVVYRKVYSGLRVARL